MVEWKVEDMKRFVRRALVALAAAWCLLAVQTHAAFAGTATLAFSDAGIVESVAGGGYAIDGTTLTIGSSGVYTVTGSCKNGNIEVKKETEGVTIVLDDLVLASSETAPLLIKKSSDVTIHLEGSSTLVDLEDPANETSADTAVADAFEGAAVKAKAGSAVTFCGSGALRVDGSACKNAIKGAAASTMVFNGGTYTVLAKNNGIAADGSLTFNAGTFAFDVGGDGIKAVPDADDAESAGKIRINGGSFAIDADGDGIQADDELVIAGGAFDIKTLNGSGKSGFDAATMSCKGIKASGDRGIDNNLVVTGGTFVLDCADDALHSDAYLSVTGGTFTILTGDDGMHADMSLTLGTEGSTVARDPDVTINGSYEGLEAGNVYLYSGRYHIVASDDGINAAGGSSNGSNPQHGGGNDPFRPGGGPGGRPGGGFWGGFGGLGGQASTGYSLNVYGGTIYVNCNGDGLDSNGTLSLRGGRQTVFGMAGGGDNSALDCDGALLIDGATVFTAGGAGMDGRVSSTGSSQRFAASNTQYNANAVVNVTVDGTLVYSDRLPRRSTYTFYSAPGLGSCSFATASGVTACKSNDWAHSWDAGVVTTPATETMSGIMTYTCTSCGAHETQTIPTTVAVAVCDHAAKDEEPDAGFPVAFVTDAGVSSVDVYYTQDYTSPDETGVSSATSRDADTGKPDSSGDGQVNFAVNVRDGYHLEAVTGTVGAYKNVKNVSGHIYRFTKISAALAVTVTTAADEVAPAPDPDPDPSATSHDVADAVVTGVQDKTYTGEAQTQRSIVVTLGSAVLTSGVDYELAYANNVGVGTATVTITGKGDYTGSKTVDFAIALPAAAADVSVSYRTHVQGIGWQGWVEDGEAAGTSGRSLRLEAVRMRLAGTGYAGGIRYRTHIQGVGWQTWMSDGELSGTESRSLRLEAVRIELTGEMAEHYDVWYRVHAQRLGWMGWATNGEASGTAGYGYRLEALEVVLVQRGGGAPGSTSTAFKSPVSYSAHVQSVGWQGSVIDGATSGTEGRRLRLEAVRISLPGSPYDGTVQYRTHVQDYGWEQGWQSGGTTSGTSGKNLRLEAIEIRLTKEWGERFDIYYRVHAQAFGWMGWAKNGEGAGTTGYGYRLEALQVVLVEKGGDAPGSTANAFVAKA